VIVDYHMHLRDVDGEINFTSAAAELFVQTAAARGVDEIGFTEHVYYFRETREFWTVPYLSERCRFELDSYCDAVLEAKARGLPVKLGLEVDYVGDRQERLAELLEPYPWDFLLGSVHWLGNVAVDMEPGVWADATVEEVWERYVKAVGELASSGAVDVLAHLDLAKIFGRRPAAEILSDLHRQVVDAIATADVSVEISTAGLRKPVGELYPDRDLLRACRRLDVGITLASDAHEPQLVGEDFDQALAAARDAGWETVTVFEGRRGRQEPLG
jgi:histidinol-phosphatase (PHP family)